MSTYENEGLCMDMGRATTDCVPRAVAEDVWTQCARHGPGQADGPVSLTNRSIIYRLRPPGGPPFLALLNGLWVDAEGDQPFQGLRALEARTGCPLRVILSPGSGHHLSLPAYARAFPDARVLVADGRIPRANPALVALNNVEVYPVDQPPADLAAAGLQIEVLAGLMEGGGTRRAQLLTAGDFRYVCDSVEPLMVLHTPSGVITSGGHHWWFVPDGHEVIVLPGVLKLLLRLMGLGLEYLTPGQVSCEIHHNFAIHDRAALQASCARVLAWDFDGLLDLHAPANTCPRQGARALFEPVMGPIARGEWDRVVWRERALPGG